MNRLWQSLVVEPWQRIEAEQRAFLARPESRGVDGKVIAILLTTAVCLTFQFYFATSVDAEQRLSDCLRGVGLDELAERHESALQDSYQRRIHILTSWAVGCLLCYTVLPVGLICLVFRERLADYGVKLRGAFTDWWIYVVMFAVMLPIVLVVSDNDAFQKQYPFYRLRPGEPLWPSFWRWEVLYCFQFVGLEFFFRGFLLHGIKHRFGVYSVLVMMVPYCMIHFGKPMPETFAAIAAGLVLGFMSLKTRSIWMGAAIHISVALTMDFVSLWRQGWLA